LPWLWCVPPHPASHSRSLFAHSPFFLRGPRGSGHVVVACSHALPSFLQLLRRRIINFFWFLPYAIKESADPKLRKSEKRYTPYPITRHPPLACPSVQVVKLCAVRLTIHRIASSLHIAVTVISGLGGVVWIIIMAVWVSQYQVRPPLPAHSAQLRTLHPEVVGSLSLFRPDTTTNPHCSMLRVHARDLPGEPSRVGCNGRQPHGQLPQGPGVKHRPLFFDLAHVWQWTVEHAPHTPTHTHTHPPTDPFDVPLRCTSCAPIRVRVCDLFESRTLPPAVRTHSW
jgi:hypothetical protein